MSSDEDNEVITVKIFLLSRLLIYYYNNYHKRRSNISNVTEYDTNIGNYRNETRRNITILVVIIIANIGKDAVDDLSIYFEQKILSEESCECLYT